MPKNTNITIGHPGRNDKIPKPFNSQMTIAALKQKRSLSKVLANISHEIISLHYIL